MNFSKTSHAADTMNAMSGVSQQKLKGTEMASKQLAGDMQAFLKILTVQMQNQDPFNPTDSSEFVAQLVQFANVEQSISQNKKLDSLIQLQKDQQAIQAINFIGKTVKYQGDTLYYDGQNPTPVTINLPKEVPNLNYTVFDSKGQFVSSQTVSAPAGPYQFSFGEGTDKSGKVIPAGAYRLEVKALDRDHLPLKDSKNNPVVLPIVLQGKVTTIEKVNQDPVLNIENVPVPYTTLLSYFDTVAPRTVGPAEVVLPAGQLGIGLDVIKQLNIPPLPLAMEEAMRS